MPPISTPGSARPLTPSMRPISAEKPSPADVDSVVDAPLGTTIATDRKRLAVVSACRTV